MLAKRFETLNGLVLLSLGSWILWYSSFFPDLPEGYPGPGLFPSTIAIGFIILGILLIGNSIRNWKEEQKQSSVDSANTRFVPFLAGIALIGLFPILYEVLGFLTTLAISCFVMALLLKVKPIWAVLTALITSGLIYLIFVVLLGLVL